MRNQIQAKRFTENHETFRWEIRQAYPRRLRPRLVLSFQSNVFITDQLQLCYLPYEMRLIVSLELTSEAMRKLEKQIQEREKALLPIYQQVCYVCAFKNQYSFLKFYL